MNVLDSSATVVGYVDDTVEEQKSLTSENIQ